MANIFELENNKSFLLYTNQNQILVRQKYGEMIGRSTLLAKDYQKDLSSFFYNGTLYFSYINTEGHITIRNTKETLPIFETDSIETHSCDHPQIVLFRNQLLLFYSSKQEYNDIHQVNCVLPFQNRKKITIADQLPTTPDIQLIVNEELLYISLYSMFSHKIICLDASLQLTELGVHTELDPKEKKHYQDQINELQKSVTDQKNQIQKMQNMLDSATRQYNDLMQVANRYREEAIKWQSKFCGK